MLKLPTMRMYTFFIIYCFFLIIHEVRSVPLASFAKFGKFSSTYPVLKTDPPKAKLYKIVIDPGHGGKDAGCSGRNSREKDIVLAIGNKIKEIANQKYPKLEIIMTRDRDEFIPLHERASIANKNKADLFVSLHCNSIGGRSHVHGSETYVLGLHRADDNLRVAKRENSAILYESDYKAKYDGFDPSSAEGHILLSMFQNAHLEQSINLAHLIENQLTDHAHRHSRGVKQAGFLVLRETTMPAVLVETGFLTHKKEEDFLRDAKGQRKVAEAIIMAIEEYAVLPELSSSEKQNSSLPKFAIQVAATSSPIDQNHPLYQKVSHLHEWVVSSGMYKYIIPAGANRRDAQDVKRQLKSQGLRDIFIIPWPDEKIGSPDYSGTK